MSNKVKKSQWPAALFALASALAVNTAIAEDAKPAASPAPAAPTAKPEAAKEPDNSMSGKMDKFIHETKNPTPWLKWGGDIRIRHEYLGYVAPGRTTAASVPLANSSYARFRGRLWTTLTPVKDFDFNARVTAEPRYWYGGGSLGSAGQPKRTAGMDWTEGIIDTFNIKYANAFDLPLTMTVGRQDMMIGEPGAPWLIADGTPGDGSRTMYFDAARFTYKLEDVKTTIDAVYIDQAARNDRWLPPINALDKYQTSDNERGVILYGSNKSIKNTTVDAYFIYKQDERVAPSPNDTFQPEMGYDGNTYTMGSRVAGTVCENWAYSTEGAYQLGRKSTTNREGKRAIDAFGVNNRVSYLFKDTLKNEARFSYEFLSGDDSSTQQNEGFDVLWGRYPRWTELVVFDYRAENGRIAQMNNMHRLGPGWSISPCSKTDVTFDYYLLYSDHNAVNTPGAMLSNNGGMRGQLFNTTLKYKQNEHLSGRLNFELFFPGNFYAHSDMNSFIRAEIMLAW
jgi:hypothetical protein